MKNIADENEFFDKLLTMLSRQFGDKCEIVLHDLSGDYEHTIVDIRNNEVTGRKIGGFGSNLGLEVLKGTSGSGDRYNYITYTKDNKILRSSSLYMHDEDGKVIGALCINLDITETTKLESFLRKYNNFDFREISNNKNGLEEYFAENVNDLLDFLINKGQEIINKPVAIMNRDEKIRFIKWLDDHGAFLISKSGEYVSDLMGISKYTFYNYLDIAHDMDIKTDVSHNER